MIFTETVLKGAFVIEPERRHDERGFFARTWCEREFAAAGLPLQWVQCNISFNKQQGTLRGMHYQAAPGGETKVVRCIRGAIYDVLVDLRPDSPSYGKWVSRELTADNRESLYVPEGVAHGFLTLTDRTEVLYLISSAYVPALARGVRWDDPAFGIQWPGTPAVISQRDRTYPDFKA